MITLKITFFFIKTSSNYSCNSLFTNSTKYSGTFPESFHPVYIEGDVNHIHYENQLTQIHLENVDYNLKNLLNRKRSCSIISTLYPTCWATAIALCVNASSFITAPGKCV